MKMRSGLVVFLAVVNSFVELGNSITLPLTGGSNDDPNMMGNPQINPNQFSGLQRTMANIYNRFGAWLDMRAAEMGVKTSDLAAVLKVESGGDGFRGTRMIIRFENHVFDNNYDGSDFFTYFTYNTDKRWTGHQWRDSPTGTFESFHGNQDKEWEVLQFAQNLAENDPQTLAESAALRSASYGAPQIMGFNYAKIGYSSVELMFQAFSNSIQNQMDGLVAFILDSPTCISGLRTENMVTFASCYNGAGKAAQYGAAIDSAAAAYRAVMSAAGFQSEPDLCSYKGLYGHCTTSCEGGISYDNEDSCSTCCIKEIECAASDDGFCADQTIPGICDSNDFESGLCPGNADILCCDPVPTVSTPSPTPTPTPPSPPISCTYKDLNGTCGASCPSGIVYAATECSDCCVPDITCTFGNLNGTCVDDTIASLCESGNFESNLCPGNADIRCCLPDACTHQGLEGICDAVCSDGRTYATTECANCCVPTTLCDYGECVDDDVPEYCASGTFYTGLCPGDVSIRCCELDEFITSNPTNSPSMQPTSVPTESPTDSPQGCEDIGNLVRDGQPVSCTTLANEGYCSSYAIVRQRCLLNCGMCETGPCIDNVPSGLARDGEPYPCSSEDIGNFCSLSFVQEACPISCDVCETVFAGSASSEVASVPENPEDVDNKDVGDSPGGNAEMAVILGAVGGVVGVGIAGALAVVAIRRRRNQQSSINNHHHNQIFGRGFVNPDDHFAKA